MSANTHPQFRRNTAKRHNENRISWQRLLAYVIFIIAFIRIITWILWFQF